MAACRRWQVSSPAAIEDAMRAAIEMKRAEVQAIASSTAPPTFENTAEALEACGRAPCAGCTVSTSVHTNSLSLGDMPAVARRMAPMLAALDDEIAHDERLFARLNARVGPARCRPACRSSSNGWLKSCASACNAVAPGWRLRPRSAWRPSTVVWPRCLSRYNQNLIEEAGEQAVFIDDESGLDGLPDALRTAAAAAAAEKGRPASGPFPTRVARCGRF
jgi:peptidyl-dipeptidase Dcp